MCRVLAACVALLVPAVALAQAPGRVDAAPRAQTQATGIVGTVVDGLSKTPLRGVKVTLGGGRLIAAPDGAIPSRDGGPLEEPRSILTNADGRFAFPDIPRGAYKVIATLNGWLPGNYGAAQPGDPGRPVLVDPGTPADITIALWRSPTLEGVVRDVNGEAIVGAKVEFLQPTVEGGRRSLGAVTSAETDDRGAFRAELLNGTYYLRVTANEESRVRTDPATRRRTTYGFRPTFYPAADALQSAEPIVLAAGDRRQNVEIRLPLRPLVRLSGGLRRAGAIDVMPATVTLESRDGLDTRYVVQLDASGRFVVPRLLPGEYLLSGGRSALQVRANVVVPPEDSEVIDLQPRSTVTIRGHAEFQGETVPSTQRISVALMGTDGGGSGDVQPDSRFTFEVAAGTYLATAGPSFSLSTTRDGRRVSEATRWSLAEAWWGSHNLVVEPVTLTGDVDDLRLVFTRLDTGIEARVSGVRDVFGPTTLVFIPESQADREIGTYGWSQITSAAGDTMFKGRVRPGNYFVAAVRSDFPYRDAAMRDALVPLATYVTILQSDTTKVELRAIDPPAFTPMPLTASNVDNVETIPAVPVNAPEVRPGAVIVGRVIEAGSGRPIPDARVSTSLLFAEEDTGYSDEEGRFILSGIKPGQYMLHATKPSWGAAVLGTTGPSGTGVEVTVNPNEQIDGLTIAMIRSAALEVIVLDPDGTPLEGWANIHQYRWKQGGRILEALPLPSKGGSPKNGRYRLSGLPPGDYIVGVDPSTPLEVEEGVSTTSRRDLDRASGRPARQSPSPATERPWRYAQTFYPGTRDAGSAQVVHLTTGEERTLTFQAERLPIATLTGVIRPPSSDHAGYSMELESLEPANRDKSHGSVENSGEFAIPDLFPGRYRVTVMKNADDDPDDAPFSLVTEVVVNGTDQDGLVLDLLPGGTVSGRLFIDGVPPSDDMLAALTFRVQSGTSSTDRAPMARARMGPDGRFSLTHVQPGLHQIIVERQGKALTLGSQRASGRETIDTGFLVQSGTDVDDVELRLTSTPAVVSGIVRNSARQPVSDTYVVLFPAEAGGRATSPRIFAARPDRQGRYSLEGVPHGRYLIAAAGDVSPNDWFNPAILQRLERAAVPVIVDGAKVELEPLLSVPDP